MSLEKKYKISSACTYFFGTLALHSLFLYLTIPYVKYIGWIIWLPMVFVYFLLINNIAKAIRE